MAVEYRFMKNFVATPTDGLSFVINVPQTLVTLVDEQAISVAINGQIIRRRTNEPTETFAKYYFETTIDRAAYDTTPEVTNIDELCSLAITVKANPNFIAPGYLTGSQSSTLLSSDIIYVSLWHTLVRAV